MGISFGSLTVSQMNTLLYIRVAKMVMGGVLASAEARKLLEGFHLQPVRTLLSCYGYKARPIMLSGRKIRL